MKLLGKLFAKILYFSVETFIKQLKNAFVFVAIARQGSFPPSVVRMRYIILTFPNISRFGERQKHSKIVVPRLVMTRRGCRRPTKEGRDAAGTGQLRDEDRDEDKDEDYRKQKRIGK